MENENNVFSGWEEESKPKKEEPKKKEEHNEPMLHIRGVSEGYVPASVMEDWGKKNEGV